MACKITRTVEHREVTLDEFIKQKSVSPFAELRQSAKSLNFLLIFGGSAKVYVQNALETSWTIEQVEDFIKENRLQDLREKLSEVYKRETPKLIDYITVATHMRNNFFKLYGGLMDRIEFNRAFAKEHGYVRSYFGATRKLIEEMLRGEYDNKEHGAHMRNLDNICANTDIQNFEASVVNTAMMKLDEWIEENNKKSMIWNCVHDSTDVYVHKSELAEVAAKTKEFFEAALPELKGMPLPIDFSISDLKQGDYYKGGRGLLSFNIKG